MMNVIKTPFSDALTLETGRQFNDVERAAQRMILIHRVFGLQAEIRDLGSTMFGCGVDVLSVRDDMLKLANEMLAAVAPRKDQSEEAA